MLATRAQALELSIVFQSLARRRHRRPTPLPRTGGGCPAPLGHRACDTLLQGSHGWHPGPDRGSRAAHRLTREGTVNLIGSGRDKAHEGRSHEGLCPGGPPGCPGPGLKGLGPGGSVLGGGAVIAAEVEQVVDLIVSGEEALSLAG